MEDEFPVGMVPVPICLEKSQEVQVDQTVPVV